MKFIMLTEGDLRMFEINEIKKDLYRSKNMAKFSHYQSGDLYYTVEIASGKYQFPISVVETKSETIIVLEKDASGIIESPKLVSTLILSEDLGITPFDAEVRGSELIRWVQKSIKNEQFIKIG